MASWQQQVKNFTEESRGVALPTIPRPLTVTQVDHITNMVLDELFELQATVSDEDRASDYISRKQHVIDLVNGRDGRKDLPPAEDKADHVAQQADAFVDIIYYILDTAAKNGIDLDPVFAAVHESNMSKRDPTTGKFILNAAGKVMKPEGYKPADIKTIFAKLLWPN